ncbi:phospholipid carrier-dependent glycosyltransferase [Microbacterium sp. 10M-3C3]|uniref:dolichyl-phosphate-mannose--protein mannosyltransferase n=1 Tax=Microbacterium sp. 10M-3C3 TaxID=2483401 RepID=UPI001F0CB35F|nr:phospholipid carrier-dependent glycosyltransferase [Microbacterium sp. 10M-3C3]
MTASAAENTLLVRDAWVDRWRARVTGDPRRQRLYAWVVPTLLTLFAGLVRFIGLGTPHAIVFDETYYVKDAWSQWNLGYPATWPDGADASFVAGDTDIFQTVGSFVVHPPLGRIFIGAGMALFGADSSFGWRVAVAAFGTATVLVLYHLARLLLGSRLWAGVAAFLFAIDGLAIVLSRIALLDGILTFFIVLAFLFVALDRRGRPGRLAELVLAHDAPPRFGPVLWARPWLVAAGAAAGAATAVKWSGLYVLAAIGLYVVVTDALDRRAAGVRVWPADAVLRQGPASFLQLVPVAAVVYLASWTGWLATDGGYSRHTVDASPATGVWAWVPLPLQNLWAYHEAMYRFHVGLSTPHGYQSPAWQWPFLIRPTSMYWQQDAAGVNGCSLPAGCTQAISSIPNPLLWWAGVAAIVFLVVWAIRRRSGRAALVLTGTAATYVPWLLYPERTIFQFYTIAILPFLVLALAFALREIAGGAASDAGRRRTGRAVVIVFLVVVALMSAFWYPVWTALPVPYEFWRLHNWLPTWV